MVNVDLGDRSYPIIIKDGALGTIGAHLKKLGLKGRAALVTNRRVGALYAQTVIASLSEAGLDPFVITLPDGEGYKTLECAQRIYDGLIRHRMERTSPVVALGGGVIGDMAGFAAATFLRGVPYIQAPTTLLAQVDSSVGGKTGVNHPRGKNLIGAFHQPKAVFIDPLVLKTLAPRQLRAGLAEVIKYGVIVDEGFFAYLEANVERLLTPGSGPLAKAIERSCRIKAGVVSADEREGGLRAILNFGHTFGHAIETGAGYGRYLHGEAVAVGMCMVAGFSAELGLCPEPDAARIIALVEACGLPARARDIPVGVVMRSLRLDKKVASGAIRFILSTGIGGVVMRKVDERDISRFYRRFMRSGRS
ncbi:MAG: 3-dehydroquinate synthase [Deltaproteobacteria bacterium]|nr:3-dehydroquinate synthase [Deltaproteobacteria bacterium]